MKALLVAEVTTYLNQSKQINERNYFQTHDEQVKSIYEGKTILQR